MIALVIRIIATLFMFMQGLFLYGLWLSGMKLNNYARFTLPLGFIATLIAIWM